MKNKSDLVHRADILAILLSSFLQGADKPTLLAVAVAFQIGDDFHRECVRLENQRVIALEGEQ